MDNEERIPPFIQEYLNKLDHEGYADFVKLTREYHKEREDYPGKFADQSAHLNAHNRATGQNRKLDFQQGMDRIDANYKKAAYQTAQKHGYKGPDPHAPSDKDFTKQGQKFQSMIDASKERQKKQEQEKKKDAAQEKKNIQSIKQQTSYKQKQAKVEFKGAQQETASGTDQSSREQQREAFKAQIQQTRNQQKQQQQDKQRDR